MAKNKETPQQILEMARGERGMSKDEFSTALGISRMWYHNVLTGGKDIDLKTLCWLAVDHCDDWLGELANQLIVLWHGEKFVPIGSHEELMQMRQFLINTEFDDMLKVGRSLSPDHFGLWAAELRDRLEKQLEAVKVQIHAEVAA